MRTSLAILANVPLSDLRGETVMTGLSMVILGYVFNRTFTEVDNRGARYFGVIWTQVFGTFSHPLNISWMSLTCTDSEERALAMALVIMAANCAGIYGAQIFRQDDWPRYRRAFIVCIAVLSFGLVCAIVRYIDGLRRRERNVQPAGKVDGESDDASGTIEDRQR